jgi:hypothetical protein
MQTRMDRVGAVAQASKDALEMIKKHRNAFAIARRLPLEFVVFQ